jgi:hypothetical protein
MSARVLAGWQCKPLAAPRALAVAGCRTLTAARALAVSGALALGPRCLSWQRGRRRRLIGQPGQRSKALCGRLGAVAAARTRGANIDLLGLAGISRSSGRSGRRTRLGALAHGQLSCLGSRRRSRVRLPCVALASIGPTGRAAL